MLNMTDSIMIYDGECPYCKIASVSVDNINEDISIIQWDHELSQKFLDVQFEDPPFGLIFIDKSKDKVWLGEDATYEIAERAKETKIFSSLLKNNYDIISDTISAITNRDREIDKYEGIYNLDVETYDIIKQINKQSNSNISDLEK